MTGRNLDSEGNVFEVGTNPLDEDEIIRGRLKPTIGQSAPFYEQANGRGLPRILLRRGTQGRDLVERLALYPKGAPSTCSQLSISRIAFASHRRSMTWIRHSTPGAG